MKRYKYERSPAIANALEVRTHAETNDLDLRPSGNRFKSRRGVAIRDFEFVGGELSAFFEGCENIIVSNCTFKEIDSRNGHALLFYGCKNVVIHNCRISGNFGNSEAIAINSGCTDFELYDNKFFNIDNLPLDVISGERDDEYTGRVKIHKNSFVNCGYRNDYWTAAGPYVDGASDVEIFENHIDCSNQDGTNSALGIEIGAENQRTANNITVRNNTIVGARKHGIIYGSYKDSMGGVRRVTFLENTFEDCANNYQAQHNAYEVTIA